MRRTILNLIIEKIEGLQACHALIVMSENLMTLDAVWSVGKHFLEERYCTNLIFYTSLAAHINIHL
jgi:hypothetical protein